MNDNFEKIIESLRQIKLSDKERGAIKNRLLFEISVSSNRKSFDQNKLFIPRISFFMRHSLSLSVLVLLFFSGSTSAVAEKALPGDLLYSVKTGLNEGVKGFWVRTVSGKEEWELELAERRLSEMSLLSRENRLTEENKRVLKNKISKLASNVENSFSPEDNFFAGAKVVEEVDIFSSTSMTQMRIDVTEDVSTTNSLGEIGLLEEADDSNIILTAKLSQTEVDYPKKIQELKNEIEDIRNEFKNMEPRLLRSQQLRVNLLLLRARESLIEAESNEDVEEFITSAEDFILRAKEEIQGAVSQNIEKTSSHVNQRALVEEALELNNLRKDKEVVPVDLLR